MPARPPERERLAALMEERRLRLGLTWEQVAEAAGISYETLRAARNGNAGIRKLTRAAIERGLQWTSGSVGAILVGGDPEAESQPAPVRKVLVSESAAVTDSDDEAATLFPDDRTLQAIWRAPGSREERLAAVRAIREKRAERPAPPRNSAIRIS